MNKTSVIYVFLIVNLFASNILAQGVNNRIRAISVPIGTNSSIPTPSDDSERIKFVLKIEKDSALYSLKADIMEHGVIIENAILSNTILSNAKVFKGNELFFEMVPDIISQPNLMTLYMYLPGGNIICRYLLCDNNQQIKYKKFEIIDQSKNSLIPLILGYVDDLQGNNEKLLDKYLKNNLITITSYEELQEKILKNMYKCLFVYHNLSDK